MMTAMVVVVGFDDNDEDDEDDKTAEAMSSGSNCSQPASQSVAEQMPVLGLRYTTIIINFSPITS